MATVAANQLYPMSTENGEAIPLDIIKPLGALVLAIPANAATSFTIPVGYSEVNISATVDMLLDFGNAAIYPAPGFYASALILQAGKAMLVQLPSAGPVVAVPIVASTAGFIYINAIQKWAGLGLNRQLNRR